MGVTCSDMGCCGEDRGGCSKLDLLSVALGGGNGRSRSFNSMSLGLGRRCWQWDNEHQRSHTKPAQVWQCWLLCSLSLRERISHCTLFHNGKENKIYCPLAIVISIAAICESRRRCLSWVSRGHALSATSADTNPPAYVETSEACMTANKANKMEKMMHIWERPEGDLFLCSVGESYLFRKRVRNHCYGFCISRKAS